LIKLTKEEYLKTWLFFIVLIAGLSNKAYSVNLQKFHFSNSPIFATLEDGLLNDGLITTDYKYIVVSSYNYVRSPFIQIDGSERDKTIIEYMHTLNLGGAYRFTDYFQVGLSTFFTYEELEPVGETEKEKVFTAGDTTIDFKYKFYDKERLSIAFTPRLYIPTGQEKYFTSDDGIGYYLGFAIDKAFDYFQLALNFGHRENANAEYDIVDYRQQFHTSVGAIIPLFGPLDLTAEFYRDTPYDSENDQAPSEINVGLRYANAKDSALFAGVGTGSLEEDNSTDARIYFGYKYFPSKNTNQKIIEEEKKYGIFYQNHDILFPTGKSEVVGINQNKLNLMVKNIKSDPYISKIVVEGYASRIGESEMNKELSKIRATVIKDYIIDQGMPADKVEIVSYGNTKADKEILNKKSDRKVSFRIYRNK
jgi:outer membrane protein OmpA-like peptidoglycan-associated protein